MNHGFNCASHENNDDKLTERILLITQRKYLKMLIKCNKTGYIALIFIVN